jgi:HEAT repeat protein
LIIGLSAVLDDPDDSVRIGAARILGEFGARADGALVPLIKRLEDPDHEVRSAAAEAITKMGAAAVPRLTLLLTDGDARVRAAAVKSLGKMRPEAIRPAYDGLVKTLEDPDVKVRVQAIRSLAMSSRDDHEAINPLARRIFDPFLRGLKHPDVKVRRAVSGALAWTGPAAARDEEAISALIPALDDPDSEVRKNAAVALRAFEGKALRAVPALRKACKDSVEDVRAMARNAIDVITQ